MARLSVHFKIHAMFPAWKEGGVAIQFKLPYCLKPWIWQEPLAE
jgi:hypothetical protein